jgi:hypothetical protein
MSEDTATGDGVEEADLLLAVTFITPPLTGLDGGVCPAGTETMLLAAVISFSAQYLRIFSIF